MSIFIPYNPDSTTTGKTLFLHPDFVTVGSQISVRARGVLDGAVASPLLKTAESTVLSVAIPPPTGTITISGSPSEGDILTAVTSIINADSETLQWSRADTELGTYGDISGATSSSYTMVSADIGKFIKCTVTATGQPPVLVVDSNVIGPVVGSQVTPLQAITWTMTAGDAATVVSSGQDIIDNDKTSQLFVAPGPRFWNGSEADNFGASSGVFATGTLSRAWWEDNYQARIRQDGGVWITMDSLTPGTMYFGGSNTKYNNAGQGDWASTDWITQAAGQVIDIEVYTKGQLPVP